MHCILPQYVRECITCENVGLAVFGAKTVRGKTKKQEIQDSTKNSAMTHCSLKSRAMY